MCMEDIRLGRKTITNELPLTIGATAIEVAAAMPLRTTLVLGAPLTGQVTYSLNPNVTAGQGLNVQLGSSAVTLTIQDHGDMVRQTWYAIGSGVGLKAAIYQTLLTEL